MALERHVADYRVLTSEELAAWRMIPPAVASDCMNRTQVMKSSIKPISPNTPICGQARTVTTMVGDCWPICVMIASAREGEIVVVDAGGVAEVAVWGGVMAEDAVRCRLGGAIVDGAVRDVADMREAGLAMYCAAATPKGPHEGFGGVLDAPASVGGVAVRSGDIVLANEDGVVVVPLERADAVLAAAQAHLLKEASWIREIRGGTSIPDLFGMQTA
ncbi:RraA family protein [Acuticoccus kandeliae]|uniref:RraA family protein n=1 Tax=Acuticoccus kandeliae TaxID=2073160 RepID=UPI000D3E7215|nr:RraA family protein [Acuticoccus kandeliae]